jgi:hypothetical protein
VAKIIGVYKAKGGPLALFLNAARRWVGSYSCDLSRVTHNPSGIKKQWGEAIRRIEQELGHTHELVYSNRAATNYASASSGREPCVLLEDDEGKLSMIMDWNDLAVSGGSVAKYEQILRSKLLMY